MNDKDDTEVLINSNKPGRGNFVVKVVKKKKKNGDEELTNNDNDTITSSTTIVELLGMKRPFPQLKSLDMDDVQQRVLDAL
mmetsp:Transcript_19076/g.27441  ORF Transcript_19076/g.27441 Transcript_19076/m.27441 type:complete len:81 (-) Transcript_19076:316-558(-)